MYLTKVYLFCGVHVSQFMTMKSAFVQMSIFGGRSQFRCYQYSVRDEHWPGIEYAHAHVCSLLPKIEKNVRNIIFMGCCWYHNGLQFLFSLMITLYKRGTYITKDLLNHDPKTTTIAIDAIRNIECLNRLGKTQTGK